MNADPGWGEFYADELPTPDAIPDAFDPSDYTAPPKVESTAAERTRTGPNQATEIVQLARARYAVVRADDSRTYAVAHNLPGVAFPLRGSGGLRQQLAAAYYDEKGRAASGGALQDALGVLEGDALNAPESRVHLRVGMAGGAVIIDRGTPAGHVVKVSASGWKLSNRSPILFRRSPVTMTMPTPVRGGTLNELRDLINVDEPGFRLIVAFVLAAYLADIAHPILALTGQQGTAKTTAARMILALIDPSAASLQSQPRSDEDWAVAAHNIYGIGLDNVSRMPPWLQDALCKAVTGDAFVRRERYSDDAVSVLRYRRPIALTTIDPGALQGDVADRLLLIELTPITPLQRRTEVEVADAFDTCRPKALGALFDLLAHVLRLRPDIDLPEKPRMADFAEVLAALDQATGWTTLADYLASAETAARDVIDGDSFASALAQFVTARGSWEGTCLDLLDLLSDERHAPDWPKTPRGASARLARITPALAASDIDVVRLPGRSSRGTRYAFAHRAACSSCGQPLADALIVAGYTTHPNCDPSEQEPA